MEAYKLIDLLIFVPGFPLGRVVGVAALGGPEMPHDQQKFQIVLVAQHQDGTKQSWRCSHSTWSLNKPLAASRWCRPVVGNHRAAARCRSVRSSLPGRIIYQMKCFETFLQR